MKLEKIIIIANFVTAVTMIPSILIYENIVSVYDIIQFQAFMMISLISSLVIFLTRQKKVKRRIFTQKTKSRVLKRQNYRCKNCDTSLNHWDFDHIKSRGDNSPSNCQALCLDCHREKTSREKRQKKSLK